MTLDHLSWLLLAPVAATGREREDQGHPELVWRCDACSLLTLVPDWTGLVSNVRYGLLPWRDLPGLGRREYVLGLSLRLRWNLRLGLQLLIPSTFAKNRVDIQTLHRQFRPLLKVLLSPLV